MVWNVEPWSAGQIVEIAYASDENYVYRRTTDRSDGRVIYERKLSDAWWDGSTPQHTGRMVRWETFNYSEKD